MWYTKLEKEQNLKISYILYTFTLTAFRYEIHPKQYLASFKEVILQLGIGYKNKPERLFYSKTQISEFIIDETQIKVGSEYIWLWVAIECETKNILGISISKERNMFVAEHFLSNVIKEYGEHPVSTDMEVLGIHHKHASSWR